MAMVNVADVGVLVGQRVMAVAMAVPEGLARLEVREILRTVGMKVVRIAVYRGVEVAVLVIEFGMAMPVAMAGSQQQACAERHGGRRQQQRWTER
jgi:hypothetical protein